MIAVRRLRGAGPGRRPHGAARVALSSSQLRASHPSYPVELSASERLTGPGGGHSELHGGLDVPRSRISSPRFHREVMSGEVGVNVRNNGRMRERGLVLDRCLDSSGEVAQRMPVRCAASARPWTRARSCSRRASVSMNSWGGWDTWCSGLRSPNNRAAACRGHCRSGCRCVRSRPWRAPYGRGDVRSAIIQSMTQRLLQQR